ncbi:hypothetical protein V8G54_022168 [Vigna mungo]|uniref:Uncharacterized protein n=1 Tax=Vigna mungo TaxID=3915 RepID=A0AAQ3RWH3_VIGMU
MQASYTFMSRGKGDLWKKKERFRGSPFSTIEIDLFLYAVSWVLRLFAVVSQVSMSAFMVSTNPGARQRSVLAAERKTAINIELLANDIVASPAVATSDEGAMGAGHDLSHHEP